MLGSKPAWVAVDAAPGDGRFAVYPDRSLEWHRAHGLIEEG